MHPYCLWLCMIIAGIVYFPLSCSYCQIVQFQCYFVCIYVPLGSSFELPSTFIWYQRSEATNQTSFTGLDQDRAVEAYRNSYSTDAVGNKAEDPKLFKGGAGDQLPQDAMNQEYLGANHSNEMPRKLPGDHATAETGVRSQFSTPSSRSLSPTRYVRPWVNVTETFPVTVHLLFV
jgi:hypothetical protein